MAQLTRAWLLGGLLGFSPVSGEAATRADWEAICQGAPYRQARPLPKTVLRSLKNAGIRLGLHGWQPTATWINEQCRVLGLGKR